MTLNYHEYLKDHPMKRYDEYTEEDIEDLARECERLAELVSLLQDEVYHLVQLLRDPPHSEASPQTEPLETRIPF